MISLTTVTDGSPSKRSYHAMTRGLILNEVVRRVDPQGRTMGQILREDVGVPGVRVGLTQDEMTMVAKQTWASMTWSLFYLFFGNKIYTTLKSSVLLVLGFLYMLPGLITRQEKPLFAEKVSNPYEFFSQDKMRKGELSSANTHASARGLAQVGNIIVNDGAAGSGLISPETIAKIHEGPKKSADAAIRGKLSNWET